MEELFWIVFVIIFAASLTNWRVNPGSPMATPTPNITTTPMATPTDSPGCWQCPGPDCDKCRTGDCYKCQTDNWCSGQPATGCDTQCVKTATECP